MQYAPLARPQPSHSIYDAALNAAKAKRAEVAATQATLTQQATEAAALIATLRNILTQRGAHVESVSAGDEAKIESSGFSVKAQAQTTTSLDRPENVSASVGDDDGEIDVTWNSVPRARNYIVECREHVEGTVPGPWEQVKIVSRSTCAAVGLVSGKKYAFRVRALGANNVESPWSDEAVSMAA